MDSKIRNTGLDKLYTLLIVFFLIAILPFILNKFLSFFNLSLYNGYWGWILYAIFQYVLPIVFLSKWLTLKLKEPLVARVDKLGIIWTILFIVLYFLLIYIVHKNFVLDRSTNQSDILLTLGNPSILGIQVELLVLSLVGPIFEELVCRGLIMHVFFTNLGMDWT